jgi:hypothetical protein
MPTFTLISTTTNQAADVASVATQNMASFSGFAMLIAGVILAFYALDRIVGSLSGRNDENVV